MRVTSFIAVQNARARCRKLRLPSSGRFGNGIALFRIALVERPGRFPPTDRVRERRRRRPLPSEAYLKLSLHTAQAATCVTAVRRVARKMRCLRLVTIRLAFRQSTESQAVRLAGPFAASHGQP